VAQIVYSLKSSFKSFFPAFAVFFLPGNIEDTILHVQIQMFMCLTILHRSNTLLSLALDLILQLPVLLSVLFQNHLQTLHNTQNAVMFGA